MDQQKGLASPLSPALDPKSGLSVKLIVTKGLRFDVSRVRSGFWNLSVIRMGMRYTAVTTFKKGKESKKKKERQGEGGRKEGRSEKEKKKKNAHDRLLTETIDNINPLKNGRR